MRKPTAIFDHGAQEPQPRSSSETTPTTSPTSVLTTASYMAPKGLDGVHRWTVLIEDAGVQAARVVARGVAYCAARESSVNVRRRGELH
jgi:hypothetical protein